MLPSNFSCSFSLPSSVSQPRLVSPWILGLAVARLACSLTAGLAHFAQVISSAARERERERETRQLSWAGLVRRLSCIYPSLLLHCPVRDWICGCTYIRSPPNSTEELRASPYFNSQAANGNDIAKPPTGHDQEESVGSVRTATRLLRITYWRCCDCVVRAPAMSRSLTGFGVTLCSPVQGGFQFLSSASISASPISICVSLPPPLSLYV